jgi:hypothetical protein
MIRGCFPKYISNSHNSIKTLKKWTKYLNRHFSKEEIQMAKKVYEKNAQYY